MLYNKIIKQNENTSDLISDQKWEKVVLLKNSISDHPDRTLKKYFPLKTSQNFNSQKEFFCRKLIWGRDGIQKKSVLYPSFLNTIVDRDAAWGLEYVKTNLIL